MVVDVFGLKKLTKEKNMFTVGTTNEIERVKWIEETLKKIPANSTILDAGAGECQFKKFCSHLKYTSQDFGEYDGKGNEGLQMGTWDTSKIDIICDIAKMPVADNSFDAVMCTEVLEHVPDAVAAIKEMMRVLKPGGYILITAPFASLTHFAPYHFATGFNKYFYQHHLSNCEIIDMPFNGNYFEYMAQEVRRIKRVAKTSSTTKVNFFDKIITHLFLLTLQRLSKRDKNSNELLAYGVHVFARKK